MDLVAEALAVGDEALEASWEALGRRLRPRFGEALGIEGILFLIGVQESGEGFQPRLRKERKQDLIMLGTHLVMEVLGIYRRVDSDRGADWRRAVDLPELQIEAQEKLLRVGIIRYFESRLP